MPVLGIDIGTTSVSGVVIDEENHVIDSLTISHGASIETAAPWERLQDAGLLIAKAEFVKEELSKSFEIECIGLTGQQHGIVYLNNDGKILSPLFTWQDGRGNLPYRESTYSGWLTEQTGYTVSSGYGLVTHFYNQLNGIVPENASCICAIHDLYGMMLTGKNRPITEPSDAHSFGFFDLKNDSFDLEAMTRVGIDTKFLPEVHRLSVQGITANGIPVAVAIGDNPASFIGATEGVDNPILVNIGTGSQVSLLCKDLISAPPLEIRPYPFGGYLLVGAALCGGKSWALTEHFFSEVLENFTGQKRSLYSALEKLLDETEDSGDHPIVIPAFLGTRTDPSKKGIISNLSPDNFTPGKLALGVLHGMADELYDMYEAYRKTGHFEANQLVGSGNGLRLNPHLRRIVEETFGGTMQLSSNPEEAAVGAAIYARRVCR